MAEDEDRDAILLRRTRLIAAALAGILAPACTPTATPSSPIDARTTEPRGPVARSPNADRDADAVKDRADGCPDAPEDRDTLLDADGCPEADADSDGVRDGEDACPLEPGKAALRPADHGCPMPCLTILPEPVILERQAFAPGSAAVPKVSKALDDVAQILIERPEMTIEIAGHASIAEKNPALALARAKAVHAYLVRKGIDADRMTPREYGHSRPLAQETTSDGQARNRRVEFRILTGAPAPERPKQR